MHEQVALRDSASRLLAHHILPFFDPLTIFKMYILAFDDPFNLNQYIKGLMIKVTLYAVFFFKIRKLLFHVVLSARVKIIYIQYICL